MTINGQRVVVLGGTSGIGYAAAELAAREGAEVIVASRSPERVRHAVAGLPEGSAGHAVDLTDPAAVSALLGDIGPFDHLIFTAGEELLVTPLRELDLDAAQKFFQLRYFGALSAVRAAAPLIRTGGSIVLTTGGAAQRPGPGWTVAASVCGAVEALTRALSVELAPVRVNAVSPGVVRTPMWDPMGDATRAELFASFAKALPVGRIGEPADIAETYLYLMKERYATGAIIPVDGGGALV